MIIPLGNPATRGSWWSFTVGKEEPRRKFAIMTCPTCGIEASLSGHEVTAAGVVTPSVQCPMDCGFHQSGVVLQGWNPDPSIDQKVELPPFQSAT